MIIPFRSPAMKKRILERYISASFLANSGIPLIDDRHAIAHNNIMIFERERVITRESSLFKWLNVTGFPPQFIPATART
jgi:acetylglutamate synthase